MAKIKDENIIDFKEWNFPTSWEKLTLKQFSQLRQGEDIYNILATLSNHTIDEVMELPVEFLDIMLNQLEFIHTEPKIDEPKNEIKIGKDVYSINTTETMKVGEYVTAEKILKADPNNYAALLAVLCRKDGEIFDSKFEAEVFEERVKMFENVPVLDVLPLVNFFLSSWEIFNAPSRLSSQIRELGNHILKDLEDSQKIGAWKKFLLKRRVNRLLKQLD